MPRCAGGGRAGSCAGWYCGKPCGVVLRRAVRGGPEGCDGRRDILPCSNGVIHEGFLAAILKFGPEIKNHCSPGAVLEGFLAAIPKSGPEIKNHCSIWADSEENLASIPKSGPEIKNHCSIWADSEENLAAIPKSEPEIKNHCSRGLVAVCRRNHSSLPQRKLESAAEDRCRDGLQAEPFSFAATKNRIGRGRSLPLRP